MYKPTHVLKEPFSGKPCHYLDIRHPEMYQRIREQEWHNAGTNMFKYCEDFPKTWILERIRPLVLENK